MTFEKAFETIKKKFDNADASKVSDLAIQITFSDEDCGGTFYAEVKNGVLAVEPYDYHDNNAALNITKSALLNYLGRRIALSKAISDGSASVYGDAAKIDELRSVIPKTEKKAAAPKKTAAVKKTAAAEKKPAAVKKAEKAEKTVKAETVKAEKAEKAVKTVKAEKKAPAAKKAKK